MNMHTCTLRQVGRVTTLLHGEGVLLELLSLLGSCCCPKVTPPQALLPLQLAWAQNRQLVGFLWQNPHSLHCATLWSGIGGFLYHNHNVVSLCTGRHSRQTQAACVMLLLYLKSKASALRLSAAAALESAWHAKAPQLRQGRRNLHTCHEQYPSVLLGYCEHANPATGWSLSVLLTTS